MKQKLSSICLLLMAVFLAISSARAQFPPNDPTNLLATPLNGGGSIAFTIPINNGGSPINNYQYSINDGASWVPCLPAVTTSPVVINGLNNGTTYAVKLRAVNGFGFAGIASATVSLTPGLLCTPTSRTTIVTSRGKYGFNGVDYTTSGVYNYDTLVNAGGCDSILKLNLTIFPEITTNTVTIGSTEYATQNLNVTHYRNGDLIPEVTDATAWSNLTTGAWCWYNNDSANYAKYGRLYNWYAVNDPRGLAPVGYHVSTVAENNNLTNTTSTFPESLVASGINIWSNNTAGTNMTGFAAFPNGTRLAAGNFSGSQTEMWLWSSTNYVSGPPNAAYGGKLNWDGTKFVSVFFMGYNKGIGMSVRLVKDPCTPTTSTTTISNCGAYEWNGQTYTASGTYTWTGTNAAGCDSTATLELSVSNPAGVDWTLQTVANPNGAEYYGIAYGDGKFVVLRSDRPTAGVMTSTDGINWTNRTTPDGRYYDDVVYGNGLFVAITRGSSQAVMTSPDGISWTLRSTPAPVPSLWNSVTYGNGMYVVVGDYGNTMYSSDGVNWALGNIPDAFGSWTDVAYGNGVFVAVGENNSNGGNLVITSTDGINWTYKTAAENNGWSTVTYGNGRFVALAATGTNRVMTSTDGTNWTSASAVSAIRWNDIIYADQKFVAVGDGASTRVMSSTDGINWTAVDAPQGGWYAVAYGNNRFVASSYNATDNDIMTSIAGAGCIPPAPACPITVSMESDTLVFNLPNCGVNITNFTAQENSGIIEFNLPNSNNEIVLANNIPSGVTTNGTSNVTLDATSFPNFSGIKILGGAGNDTLNVEEGLSMNNIYSGNPNKSITILMDGASDQILTGYVIAAVGTGDVSINVGLGYTANVGSGGKIKLQSAGDINAISVMNEYGTGVDITSSNGGVTVAESGIYSLGAVNVNANGAVVIQGSGINNADGTANVNVTSSNSTISVNDLSINSKGKITLSSYGNIAIGGSGLNNGYGSLGIEVTSSNGGITVAGQGIATNGVINVNAFGPVSISGSGLSNEYFTNNVNVTSVGSTISVTDNAIVSKGKITLSAYGDLSIAGSGVRNSYGSPGIDVTSSNGGITIAGQGIATNGVINVNAFGPVRISSSGLSNEYFTNDVNVTSVGSTISLSDNAIYSKGKITLSAYGDVGIAGSGLRNGYGSLGIDVTSSNGGIRVVDGGIYSSGEINVNAFGGVNIGGSGVSNAYSNTNVNVTSTNDSILVTNGGITSNGIVSLNSNANLTINSNGVSNLYGMGVNLFSQSGTINVADGGVRSGSPISFKSNKVNINSNAVNANASNVFFGMTSGVNNYNLGGDDTNNALGLTSAELNSINAGTVNLVGSTIANDNITVNAPVTAQNIRLAFPNDDNATLSAISTSLLLQDSIKVKAMDLSGVDQYTTSVYSRTNAHALTVTEGVTIGSNTTLNIASLFAGLVPRDNVTLIDNQSANPVVGNFLGINESDTFTLSDVNGLEHHIRISYVGGDGNDVVLSEFNPCETTYSTTTIANCVSYTWNGNVYTVSGTYVDTLVNAGGCDSIATLELTIKQPTTSTTDITSCDSYTWNSATYTSSGTYTFTTTNAAGCDSTATLNLTINTSSVAGSSVSATDSIVNYGSTTTLTVNGGSLGTAASWKWYKGSCGGTSIGSGSSITVTIDGNATYYVRAEGTCNTTSCVSKSISVRCGATSITSNATNNTICPGSSITLTAVGALTPGAQWKWYSECESGDGHLLGATILASKTFTPTKTTTYYLRSVGGSCGTTACLPITVTVTAKPATPVAIIGDAKVCVSTTSTYTVATVSSATSYTWTVPTNSSIVSGQGTTSITVSFANAFASGNISVVASNCAGSSLAKTLAVSKNTAPTTPGTISGPTVGLCKQLAAVYSVAAVSTATSYTWTVPTGAIIVIGQGTSTIIVNFTNATLGASNTLSVKANNCAGSSAVKTLTFSGIPAKPTSITGPTKPCKNTVVTYSTVLVAGASSYIWTVPTGWTIQSGQNTSTITVKTGTTSGAITVTAASSCGNSAALSTSITIGTCTGRNEEPEYTTVNSADVIDVNFYPNPTSDLIHLATKGNTPNAIEIYNMMGQRVVVSNWKTTLSVSQLSRGTYLVKFLYSDKKVVTQKLIKN